MSVVPVANPSFESVAGADDHPIGVAVWSIPGSVGNAYNPINSGYTNATDTSVTHGVLPGPGDGKQILFINGSGSASQTLSTELAANTVYSLRVAIGNRGDLVMQNYRISLLAGTTVIASASGDGETTAANFSFKDVTATSLAKGATSSLVGQNLKIVLTNLNTKPGGALQVNFDNVRLTSQKVPVPIAVGNASFESAVGADDRPIGVALWSIPGSVGNAYNPIDSGYTNATDTSVTHGFLPGPGDGKQVLFINGSGSASQTLSTKFAANTVYSLRVAIGNRGDLVMQNYRISLLAGTTVIATASGDGETTAANFSFKDVTATSLARGATSSLVGQNLKIVLTNLDTKPGGALQVNFDNVRLTSQTVPVSIAVGNSSFESAVGADDQPIGVALWSIPGSVGNAYNPIDSGYTNATDSSVTHGVLSGPGDGKQVLFINGAGSASQTLTATFAANTSYTLTVAVGNRGDLQMQEYGISLYAGSTKIASAVGSGETTAANFKFADVSATASEVGSSSSLVGQKLRIVLSNLDALPGGAVQVNFDNVRLTALQS